MRTAYGRAGMDILIRDPYGVTADLSTGDAVAGSLLERRPASRIRVPAFHRLQVTEQRPVYGCESERGNPRSGSSDGMSDVTPDAGWPPRTATTTDSRAIR